MRTHDVCKLVVLCALHALYAHIVLYQAWDALDHWGIAFRVAVPVVLFNVWWAQLFRRVIAVDLAAEYVYITGIVGGGGKSTLARGMAESGGVPFACVDAYKYTASWARNPQFREDFTRSVIEDRRVRVLEGLWVDTGDDTQTELVFAWLRARAVDNKVVVLRIDVPRWVALFRKLLRSLKRALRLAPQGAAPEKLANVCAMAAKTWRTYDAQKRALDRNFRKLQRELPGVLALQCQWPENPVVVPAYLQYVA